VQVYGRAFVIRAASAQVLVTIPSPESGVQLKTDADVTEKLNGSPEFVTRNLVVTQQSGANSEVGRKPSPGIG
jgi:hypothetical protein